MSCPSYDWKAYALGELDAQSRREAEAHAATCSACRDELAGLRLTLDAMSTLREEEIPRRIAFVSDKVFEPRWWQIFLKPSFAGGCLIALAILVHAFVQPGVQEQIDRAVAQIEQRQTDQMKAVASALDLIEKQNRNMYIKAAGLVRE